jgi:COP9 signalosome complex subunit 7
VSLPPHHRHHGANQSFKRSRGKCLALQKSPKFAFANTASPKQPFLALSKSATSPRAAADLITRATSAPNIFIFAELLETPTIASTASSPHHTLLQIFSYGTYATYRSTPDLPDLTPAQTLKLRQLSLLTLARQRRNLTYGRLREELGLESVRELEEVVIAAVYAGLLSATLDPARQAVQVSSVAPLRDLAPGAVPSMLTALTTWSDRCTETLADLEAQIATVRAAAVAREKERREAEEKLQSAVADVKEAEAKNEEHGGKGGLKGRGVGRRPVMDVGSMVNAESMDLDGPAEEKQRPNKRKM